ncbi:efflux transporter outer membrane subunit [Desertivirga xinjiangensis]|uniref:efflux transporter outer membrane subunit n=1 Tax=Desertivirga xinjiangensis TaxID=539206 RepID=UPI002109BB62|nr:efflux transporter outer membrane subunit [Pedobacter xinjiangensis]
MSLIKIFNYILIISVLLGSGCKVGQNYQRPSVQVPVGFDSTSHSDTSSIASIKWNSFFKDTALVTLIDSGLQYNNDLQVAVKRIDIAEQQLKQARLSLLPQLNLQVAASYTKLSENSLNGLSAGQFGITDIENYTGSLNLSWELDIWGKIRRQKESALAQYFQTYEATKAVQTQLVANIAQGYYNLLMLDKQLTIARRNLSLNDSTLVLTRLLKASGDVTDLAIQQSEAQRQATALLIPQLEQAITLQENALQLLAGRLPGRIKRVDTDQGEELNPGVKTGLPAAIVSRRPDIRANEMALKSANAAVGVAQASMYPSLTLFAGGGIESLSFDKWFNVPASLFGLASGALVQPVFNGRALKTQYETAKLRREQAVLQFRQSVLVAMSEVSNALVQTKKLSEQRTLAQQQVETLQKATRNANLLFQSDMANYLEVITAQRSALQAELNLVAIQRQQKGAVVELYRALGGGW